MQFFFNTKVFLKNTVPGASFIIIEQNQYKTKRNYHFLICKSASEISNLLVRWSQSKTNTNLRGPAINHRVRRT